MGRVWGRLFKQAHQGEAGMSGTPNGPKRPSQIERALTDFLEHTTEGFHRLGPNGIILWANRAELDLLGYAPHEYIGHHVAQFHADRAVIDDILQRLAGGESVRNHPARLVGRDGSLRDVVINASALFGDGHVVHTRGCTTDAIQQRETEETRARLGAIIESCDDAIIGKTLDGIITSWNPGAERIFGYTASEAVGRHITLIIPVDRHAEENDVLARLRRVERIDHFETERRAKDGRKVSISLSVSPIKDGGGRVIGATKVARDITQRKQAEQERERLLAGEKAARAEAEAAGRARDEFVATLSHELRTPLNAILGWARMLTSGQLDEQGTRRALEVIERNTEVQNQLIGDLLDVSRIITGKMTLILRRVDLASVLQDALDSVRPTAGLKRIEFEARLEPSREVAWGDGDRGEVYP
jgi:PAS domain S-box-containing protein